MNQTVRRLAAAGLAAIVASALTLGLPAPAQAQQAESHTGSAVVAPRYGEGIISMTARTCGTTTNWRNVAAAAGIVGPGYVVYYGWRYTINCAATGVRPASSTASRSAPRGWVHPVPGAYGHGGGCFGVWRGDHRHAGVDLARPYGTPIRAAHAGRVDRAGWIWGGYGISVVLNHSGVMTHYAHLSREIVTPGQRVATGQTIGYVGSTGNSTGPHLHFEVSYQTRVLGSQVNPAPFMRARGVNIGC